MSDGILAWDVTIPEVQRSSMGARPRGTLSLITSDRGEESFTLPLAVARSLKASHDADELHPESRAELLWIVKDRSLRCAALRISFFHVSGARESHSRMHRRIYHEVRVLLLQTVECRPVTAWYAVHVDPSDIEAMILGIVGNVRVDPKRLFTADDKQQLLSIIAVALIFENYL